MLPGPHESPHPRSRLGQSAHAERHASGARRCAVLVRRRGATWQSCVDPNLVVAESVAHDAPPRTTAASSSRSTRTARGHLARLVCRCGSARSTFLAIGACPPTRGSDWGWSNDEAQKAFTAGCVLFGRRVGRTVYVEEPPVGRRRPVTEETDHVAESAILPVTIPAELLADLVRGLARRRRGSWR